MQKKFCLLVLALLCVPSLGTAQRAEALRTVEDLVRVAIEQNRDLAAARARIDEARGAHLQARVRPVPTLEFTGSTGKLTGADNENQYGASISQAVEAPGRRANRVAVAGMGLQAMKAGYKDRVVAFICSLKISYVEFSAQRLKLDVLDEQIRLQETALRLTQARVKEGDAATLEASLQKSELARTKLMRASVESRLRVAEIELRRLAGISVDIKLPDPVQLQDDPVERKALQALALEERADLAITRYEEEREVASLALARSESRQELTFSAGWMHQSSSFDGLLASNYLGQLKPLREQSNTLTFSLSVPLRTPNSTRGTRIGAIARSDSARAHRLALEQSIPLEVDSAYERWKTAKTNALEIRTSILPDSAANLQVMREAYKLGQLRVIDVLNEQRRYLDDQLMAIDAEQDTERACAELERTAGGRLK